MRNALKFFVVGFLLCRPAYGQLTQQFPLYVGGLTSASVPLGVTAFLPEVHGTIDLTTQNAAITATNIISHAFAGPYCACWYLENTQHQ